MKSNCSGAPARPSAGRLALLPQMLLLTGQRRDEIGGMSRREISLETATWSLAGERVKNDQAHIVALSEAAIRILESLPRIEGERDLIFTTNGASPVSGFSRAKRRIDAIMLELARADDPAAKEIPQWQFHDLRRTAVSGMASLKVAPHIVDAAINHKSGAIKGVAAVYNRYTYADERRAALESWGRHVERLVTGEPESNVVALRPAKV